jgi:hypothetical protein
MPSAAKAHSDQLGLWPDATPIVTVTTQKVSVCPARDWSARVADGSASPDARFWVSSYTSAMVLIGAYPVSGDDFYTIVWLAPDAPPESHKAARLLITSTTRVISAAAWPTWWDVVETAGRLWPDRFRPADVMRQSEVSARLGRERALACIQDILKRLGHHHTEACSRVNISRGQGFSDPVLVAMEAAASQAERIALEAVAQSKIDQ